MEPRVIVCAEVITLVLTYSVCGGYVNPITRMKFLLISLVGTFIVTRTYLHLSPNSDFNVGPYNIHHLFTGLLLLTVFGLPLVMRVLSGNREKIAVIGFGIGLSLALDEWVYLIATDGSNASYLLPVSYWGGIVMVGLACGIVGLGVWVNRQKEPTPK